MLEPKPSQSETPKTLPAAPSPQGYAKLEPGLQAAIDLLTREAMNEQSAGQVAEARDRMVTALEHAHHYQAYMTAVELLQEQMARLKPVDIGTEIPKFWPGHPGEAG
jgi:hypothetical protein